MERRAIMVAMLLFAALAWLCVGSMGCVHGFQGEKVLAERGVGPVSNSQFCRLMNAGYEKAFPDSEEVLFTEGSANFDGKDYVVFAWRDHEGRLNVVINGAITPSKTREGFTVIRIAGIGKEILGPDQEWIGAQKSQFTWLRRMKTEDDPMRMFRDTQKMLRESGAENIGLLVHKR